MSELTVNRINTKRFIDADPVEVTLERKTKVVNDDNSYKWGDPVPVDPQIMRLIPLADSMPIIQTADGFQRTPGYVLLGTHDCDMEIWDYFEVQDVKYQIVSPIRPIHTDNAYERKGDVALV